MRRLTSVVLVFLLVGLDVLPVPCLGAEAKQSLAAPADQPRGELPAEDPHAPLATEFSRRYVDTPRSKVLVSRRVSAPPVLDGVLDDPCWKIADRTKSAFIEWLTKTPSLKQTVVYACHDLKNLYLAVVCEEPKPKSVRMLSRHPGGRRSWGTVGRGDCAEAFIEVGGVGGKGQVFQFIFNIYPEVRYDGLYPPYVPFIGTGYELGGALGKAHWTCEIAFPYAGLNADRTERVDYHYAGPPRRGEVWGLRVVRNGPRVQREKRMRSSWTHNPNSSWHIPWPTGLIVFGDRNALRNGNLRELEGGTPVGWEVRKLADGAKLKFSTASPTAHAELTTKAPDEAGGVSITQEFGVLPGNDYKVTAEVRKSTASGRLLLKIDKPQAQSEARQVGRWDVLTVRFRAGAEQHTARATLSLLGKSVAVTVSKVRAEQVISPPVERDSSLQ